MEFNRNQYFFVGILVLLIGLQLRLVLSYTLTPEATKILAGRQSVATASNESNVSFASNAPTLGQRKVIRPPDWIGWCMISVGAVLILHSLAMRKPD